MLLLLLLLLLPVRLLLRRRRLLLLCCCWGGSAVSRRSGRHGLDGAGSRSAELRRAHSAAAPQHSRCSGWSGSRLARRLAALLLQQVLLAQGAPFVVIAMASPPGEAASSLGADDEPELAAPAEDGLGAGAGGAAREPELCTAKGMSRDEVRRELAARGVKPTGITGDDAARLNVELKREFEAAHAAWRAREEEKTELLRRDDESLRAEVAAQREEREERRLLAACPVLALFIELARKSKTHPSVALQGGPALGRAVARVLPDCTSLVALDLSNGELRDAGASALAQALQGAGVLLRRLDLDSNGIGPLGVKGLGMALSVNCSLSALSLENNNLTKDYADQQGVKALASALAANATLTSLNLSRCALGLAGVAAVAAAVVKNGQLVILDMDFNGSAKPADVAAVLARIDDNKAARAKREEEQAQLRALELHHQRFQAAKEDKECKLREDKEAADLRSKLRQEHRLAAYEKARQDKAIALEDGRVRAYAHQQAIDESNAQSKGKKKKK